MMSACVANRKCSVNLPNAALATVGDDYRRAFVPGGLLCSHAGAHVVAGGVVAG